MTQDGKTLRLAQNLLVQLARSTAETRKLARRIQKQSVMTEGKPEDAASIAIHACRDIACAGGGGTGKTKMSEDTTANPSGPAPKAPASTEGAGRAVASVRPEKLVSMVMATCVTLVSQLAPAAATPVGKVEQPAGLLLSGAESIATAMMAVAMLLMMIKMLAVCGFCFGGKAESTAVGAALGDDVDEVIAFEAPGSEVRTHAGF